MIGDETAATTHGFSAGGVALVGFARALWEASTLHELERAFARRFGQVLAVPMYGFYRLDRDTVAIEHEFSVNVSDVFVNRYIRMMDEDPLLVRSRESRLPVYNLDLMSEAEWKELKIYRDAYSMHRMLHVVEIPIVNGGDVIGALHFGSNDADRNFTASDLRLGQAIAEVLALSCGRIQRRRESDRARDEALAALELTGTALVASDRQSPDVRVNEAARQLLSELVDPDECLPPLLARRPGERRFARRVEVMLHCGESALLHAHSQVTHDGGLVSVLELQREYPELDKRLMGALTAREAEVAALIIAGLSDPEIAERLYLSRSTVHQHVKRIYRALGVNSRVSLTRLLLPAPCRVRRS